MGAPKGLRTLEAIALTTLSAGQSFFTTKQDRDITAICSKYKIKVKTERLFTICPTTGETERVVKVTLL